MKKIVNLCPLYMCVLPLSETQIKIFCLQESIQGLLQMRDIFPSLHIFYFHSFLDDSIPKDRKLGLKFGNVLMDKCREVWSLESISQKGMECGNKEGN